MAKTAVKYTRLRPVTDFKKGKEDFYYDDQFEDIDRNKPPLKSIVLAIFLFTVGSILLTAGALMLAGVFGEKYGGKASPLLIVGTICFLPGFYNVRIAYYAWKGYYGYSYDDIPS